MFSLQQNKRTRVRGDVAQIMYPHVSKCKNNKIHIYIINILMQYNNLFQFVKMGHVFCNYKCGLEGNDEERSEVYCLNDI
jgi:hypothetical protein